MTNNELTNNELSNNEPTNNYSAQNLPARFIITQKLTMMVNRYEIRVADANGVAGPVVAMAQQKRMAFKEQVTFYADEARTQPVFGFKARQRIDLGATYDVTDASGTPIGSFRKEFAKSMLRSTWQLTATDGLQAMGTERNHAVAILRRLFDSVPWVFHFDFTAPDGSLVLSSERRFGLRDRYDVQLPVLPNGWQLDWRVGMAMAVALDALQTR